MTPPSEAALREVEAALDRGDLLLAFDLADDSRSRFPDAEAIRHKGVLALARTGAVDRAESLFFEWGLAESKDLDVLALGARLKKDRALSAARTARQAAFADAASAYEALDRRQPDYYFAINQASMRLLAGEAEAASEQARRVLAMAPVTEGADYYALASRAEAELLLGRVDAASASLAHAAAARSMPGDRSTTLRQLRLVLAAQGRTPDEINDVLAPLRPPPVVHYTGHMIAGNGRSAAFGHEMEAAAQVQIEAAVAKLAPGTGFGSLASGADILFAEALLSRGAELNIVLPLSPDEFVARSVRPAGQSWVTRYAACVDHPKTQVSCIDEDLDTADPSLFGFGAQIAMGKAILRARYLEGVAVQLALWDGMEHGGPAGTCADIRTWARTGKWRQIVLPLNGVAAAPRQSDLPAPAGRPFHAVIFGDIGGFTRLADAELPNFWSDVMGALADELNCWEEAVVFRATWGDAIHLVVADVRSAADLCLAMQRRLASIDTARFAEVPTMRIGAHYGPVYRGWDPVLAQHTYYGRVLSRAARIEPVAPPGRVYVTEAFAAILALEADEAYACTYVGRVPLAKGYGSFRMYDLAERQLTA